jgi:hypothetical membrane protein
MEGVKMIKKNFVVIAAILMVFSYLLFSGLAGAKYPANFSPATNWLSDLGSSVKNPNGAVFYNLGIIITGLLVIFFFIGLGAIKQAGNKKQRVMLLLTQICGIGGGIAMMMSALFPIVTGGLHSFWSAGIYILLGTAFGFSVAVLQYMPEIPKWVLIIGILVTLEDFIWSVVLNIYPLEWVTVALFLGYILLLGAVTRITARS